MRRPRKWVTRYAMVRATRKRMTRAQRAGFAELNIEELQRTHGVKSPFVVGLVVVIFLVALGIQALWVGIG